LNDPRHDADDLGIAAAPDRRRRSPDASTLFGVTDGAHPPVALSCRAHSRIRRGSMRIARLKLHHFPASRSGRVKWALHEVVGDDFEVVRVPLYDGAQYTPEFLRLNPNHAVPVLEIAWDDGSSMTMVESAAMVMFLADAFPERDLAPPPGPTQARADYVQALQFGATTFDLALWQIRVHEHVLLSEHADARVAARYRKKITEEIEPQLLRRLDAGPFVCGERFTAADCVIGHDVMWARGYGLCQDERFRRYLSRVSKRHAFVDAFADAHEFRPQVPRESALVQRFSG
jgi:glutathione S-transferase